MALFIALACAGSASAELRIDSVSPNVGKVGEPLTVTLKGSGFDSGTKVSVALDSGNTTKIIGSVATQGGAWDVTVAGNYMHSWQIWMQVFR